MKKRLILLFLTMALFLAIKMPVFAADSNTVTVTVERFALGGNFIVEPTIVEFNKGDSYADILEKVLKERNITWSASDSTYGYYLQGINGVDCGSKNIPQCVKNILKDMNLKVGDNQKNGLYEFSYTSASGWMYYINNEYVPLGMGNMFPQGGEVVRYMFTLSYGADLTGTLDKSMTADGKDKKYYTTADKSKLIQYMAKINQDKARWEAVDGFYDSYAYANEMMAKMNALRYEVNDALYELQEYEEKLPPLPDSIALNKTSLELEMGQKANLSCTLAPANSATTIHWSSDKASVATVQNGVVTGIGKGTTKIHAKTINGLDVSCSITVKEDPAATAFKTGNPSSISVKATAYNSVKVSWKKYTNATGYEVYRKTSSGSYKKLKNVTGTSYTDKTAATGTTYYYRVRAKSSKWGGTTYSKYTASKKVATKLGTVTLKSVTAGKKCAVVKWSKVSGATGYKVYRATKKSGKYTCIKTVKTTSYKNTKLTKGKTYYYKIRAYRNVNKKAVYGGYSKVKSVKVK